MPDDGPYETSDQVRQLPAVRTVYDVMHAALGRGAGQDDCEKLVTGACEKAQVTLGAYDARIIRWLANWEPETCAVIAGLIARAAQRPEGTVIEWAISYTHTSALFPQGREVVQPYPDEEMAREALAQPRELAPEDEPGVMSREIGPWTPADEPATREGESP